MNYAQVVDVCCRDLRRYLEHAVQVTRGGVVTVKMSRVLQAPPPSLNRRRYSLCLSSILRQWRWSVGVYVVPRRDAETLLANFDELCASVKRNQRPAENAYRVDAPARATGEETALVSFHVPRALVQAIDEYARLKNTTRSDVVRAAIARLIEKYRSVEVDIQRPSALAAPAAPEDELVAVTFHETRYLAELLDMYAAALQISRSDAVRTAIRQMLDEIRTSETREESEHAVVI
jgi:metal-responsive CopG/Arc/MetJ family transcriptional regulator